MSQEGYRPTVISSTPAFPNDVTGRLQTYSYIFHTGIPKRCQRKATDLQLYLPHWHSQTMSKEGYRPTVISSMQAFPNDVIGRLQTYSYIFHTGMSQVSQEGYRTTVISSMQTFPNSVIGRLQNFSIENELSQTAYWRQTIFGDGRGQDPSSDLRHRAESDARCVCKGVSGRNGEGWRVVVAFSVINGSGPAYLSELLHVYTPSGALRSSSETRLLKIQQYNRRSHGFRTFSCLDPTFGIHSHKTLDTAQPCHIVKPN